MINKFNNIVLNIPHASIGNWSEGWNDPVWLFYHMKKWTDWHTDILFKPSKDLSDRVIPVVFEQSRFFCDAERLKNDPLEDKGQGIIYTKFENCSRTLSDVDKEALGRYWESHQEFLKFEIQSDDTLLLDCHSFPSDLSDVHICIGFNDDWSKPSDDVIDFVKGAFEGLGYKVGINKPYGNSITPESSYKYKSMMIEVNKKCYMNEDTLVLNGFGFELLNKTLNDIYKQLLV